MTAVAVWGGCGSGSGSVRVSERASEEMNVRARVARGVEDSAAAAAAVSCR